MLVNPEGEGDKFYNEDQDPEFPEDESQVASVKANPVNIPKRKKTLQKIPKFHLSYCCGNFVETHSFCITRTSAETVRFRKISTPGNRVKFRYFTY